MKVIFQIHNAKGPAGEAIKGVSGGPVTHVSIRCTDDQSAFISKYLRIDHVWEARFGEKIKPIPWADYKFKKNIVEEISFEIDRETAREAIAWLEEQEGKGYDYWGVASFLWFWIKPKIGKWFCSELAMVFLMKFIAKMQEYDQKQTPYGFKLIGLMVYQLKNAIF